tara:strand:- start:643 stop:2457 length:1815 start_codon:yes stop_codon:yes gene_type:complete
MSSIIERLTEGVVNRDMRAEGSALLSKWEKTGLLEGLKDDRQKNSMARLLENQAKELLREASTLAAGDVEGFAAVAFPIVRRVFAGLIANDLVSVQPMSLPSGLIFFLDFVFSENIGDGLTQASRFGNTKDKSIYGTDQVGSQVTGGVDLVGATLHEDLSGPRTSARGYAYASPSGSNTTTPSADASGYQVKAAFLLNGAVTEANAKLIEYDADLLADTAGTRNVVVVDIVSSDITSDSGANDADFDNLSAFTLDPTEMNTRLTAIDNNTNKLIRRLTRVVPATEAATSAEAVRFVLVDTGVSDPTSKTISGAISAGKIGFPLRDQIDASSTVGAVVGDLFPLEANESIPEIDIKVDSIAVTAQTKKLKAKWSPELGQDLNAYHNLDAEVELTSILSEQVALEIDREILADLVGGATAATYYWSRSPGLFVNRETGAELGATSAAPDFTGTVSEWYETLVETINDVSAQIHRKTLRGGANFVVCSPEVANILEFTAGFRASVTHDEESGSIGAVQVGSLSKKFDVIVDPYFLRNVILVGRRGNSFLESGYVYAPYVPLQTTPTIFGPEDFVPRKGVMTRYAKKMVRPDMYGLVICRGLLGESGS